MRLVNQVIEVGFGPGIMAFSVGPLDPAFIEGLGSDAEFIWGPTQWERELNYSGPIFGSAADYAERFWQEYGEWPTYHNASGTAAGVAFQLALEQAGTLDRQQVRDALTSLDVMTFYGPIRFDETGKNAGKPMVSIQIQHGQRVLDAEVERLRSLVALAQLRTAEA
jgi:branched-chain amino acid transport system substrate-binding protein